MANRELLGDIELGLAAVSLAWQDRDAEAKRLNGLKGTEREAVAGRLEEVQKWQNIFWGMRLFAEYMMEGEHSAGGMLIAEWTERGRARWKEAVQKAQDLSIFGPRSDDEIRTGFGDKE